VAGSRGRFPGGAGGAQFDPEAAQRLFDLFGGGLGGGGGNVDLGDLFGGGPRRKTRGPKARRPEAVESEVTVPFDVAANGGSVAMEIDGRRIDVKVPAGIEEGKRLRVPAEATGGSDVLLKVKIARTRTSGARATTSSSTCR